MRALFLAILVLATAPAIAREPIHVDYRCLTTAGGKPVQLEWRTFSEKETDWIAAYVKYKGSKKVIPLVLQSTKSTEVTPGRPMENKAVWLEVSEGKITGEYAVTSQGAIIGGFVYKNYRSGKKFEFSQDNAAPGADDSCQWK